MRAGITVQVTPDDRRRLEAIVSDRNALQKHVWRAKTILAMADGCGTSEIMRRSGKAKPVVWRCTRVRRAPKTQIGRKHDTGIPKIGFRFLL